MTLPELTEKVRLIYNKLNFLLEQDMPYVLFIIIPVCLLLVMYLFNNRLVEKVQMSQKKQDELEKKLESLINKNNENSSDINIKKLKDEIKKLKKSQRWFWQKFLTTPSLFISFFLIIFYFLYIYFERHENIFLSLSILLPMFSGWFISGVYREVRFVDTIKIIKNIENKIRQINRKSSDSLLEDLKKIEIDLYAISLQGQIITTIIVLLSLSIRVFIVDEYLVFGLIAAFIVALGMFSIPGYNKLLDKIEKGKKEFSSTTTLYFLGFSLKDSPKLLRSFLIPRAISVIMVIWFSIYYNPVQEKQKTENYIDQNSTKQVHKITGLIKNNNSK